MFYGRSQSAADPALRAPINPGRARARLVKRLAHEFGAAKLASCRPFANLPWKHHCQLHIFDRFVLRAQCMDRGAICNSRFESRQLILPFIRRPPSEPPADASSTICARPDTASRTASSSERNRCRRRLAESANRTTTFHAHPSSSHRMDDPILAWCELTSRYRISADGCGRAPPHD